VTQVGLEVTIMSSATVLPTAVVRDQVFTQKKNIDYYVNHVYRRKDKPLGLKKINI
jgi:hypothetical protein